MSDADSGPTEITSRFETVGLADSKSEDTACSGPSASTAGAQAADPLTQQPAEDGAEAASSAATGSAESDAPTESCDVPPATPFAFTFSLQASGKSSRATYDLAAPMVARGDTPPQTGAAVQLAGVRSSGKVKTKGRRPQADAEFDAADELEPPSPQRGLSDGPVAVKFDPDKFSLSF